MARAMHHVIERKPDKSPFGRFGFLSRVYEKLDPLTMEVLLIVCDPNPESAQRGGRLHGEAWYSTVYNGHDEVHSQRHAPYQHCQGAYRVRRQHSRISNHMVMLQLVEDHT